MKKKRLISISAICALVMSVFCIAQPASVEASETSIPVYRIYNPNTGEHFYTTSKGEADRCISVGWNDEGIGWYTALSGDPVYRVYNPNANGGDHYYTKNKSEASYLVKLGWMWDYGGNPVFYSYGDTNLYVAYNPTPNISGSHNYTTNRAEQNFLLKAGWTYDQVAWKVMTRQKTYTVSVPVDIGCVGEGGAEDWSNPASYRKLYSDKPFDKANITETPEMEFSADIVLNGSGNDYGVQFIVAGVPQAAGQIGLALHYQAGSDDRYGQGRINATTVNFPAKSGIYGEQFYSVNTAYPAIKNGAPVHVCVKYYGSGYVQTFVENTMVGQYKTKLIPGYTSEKGIDFVLHFNADTNCTVSNIAVYKMGKEVTHANGLGFREDFYDISNGVPISALY